MLLFVVFLYRVLNALIRFMRILPEYLRLRQVAFSDLHFHILISRFSALKNYFVKSVRTFILVRLGFLHGVPIFQLPNLFGFPCNVSLLSQPSLPFHCELILVI